MLSSTLIVKCIAILLLLVHFVACAQGNSFLSVRAQMSAAREASTELILNTGTRTPVQKRAVIESIDAVSIRLQSLTAPPGKEAHLRELRSTWQEYSRTVTRDLLPATQNNRDIEAKQLLLGVLRERFNHCQQLLNVLIKSSAR